MFKNVHTYRCYKCISYIEYMKYHKYGIFSSLALFLVLDISTCLQQYILSLSEVGYFYHILLKYILKSKKNVRHNLANTNIYSIYIKVFSN